MGDRGIVPTGDQLLRQTKANHVVSVTDRISGDGTTGRNHMTGSSKSEVQR